MHRNVLNYQHLTYFCLILLLLLISFPGQTEAAQNNGKIALVMKSLENPFFLTMEHGAKKYARNNDISLDIFGTERETDVENQISIIESLIAQKYQAIILAPVDSKRLIPVCKKALENQIIVINIDNPLHQETLKKLNLMIPFVGSDNRAGGRLIGQYIRRKLKGKGRVFLIEGIRGVENAELRRQGFIEQLTKDSAIKIIASESANWHTDEAFLVSSKLLDVYGKVDAILCANDNMALGVLQALELKGYDGKVLIGSYDNIAEVREEMRRNRIHATIEQHPDLMGSYGVKLAQLAIRGKKVSAKLDVPLDLVTHEGFQQSLGLSISSLKNPFFSLLVEGATDSAKIQGSTLFVADAEDRDDKQLSDILEFIEKGVSAIIVNPTNADTIVPGIELANSKGIPVLVVDRTITGGKVVSLVASDNLAGGELAARVLAGRLKGIGRVVELEGIPGTSATADRGTGFNRVLNEYPGLKIVARESALFERVQAKNIIAKLMTEGLTFDAVFAHNDTMILGALDALKASGETTKVLIGFDGIQEVLEAINNGQITATVAQVPREMGRIVIVKAVKHLRGEPVEEFIPVALEAIERRD